MSRLSPRQALAALRRASALPDDLPDDTAQRLAAVEGQVGEALREFRRIGPQVAALEARLETLEERLEPAPTGDAAEHAEARSLVEEVRTEHARVRARISAATVFEERLRVLEERLRIDSATGRPLSD